MYYLVLLLELWNISPPKIGAGVKHPLITIIKIYNTGKMIERFQAVHKHQAKRAVIVARE
jgi:hypothetical protein